MTTRGSSAARSLAAAGLIVWVAGVCGCAYFKEKPELTAEENFRKGTEEFNKEHYESAIPFFQKILESYPFSIHAVPAELKVGECYFLEEKYPEALVHLQGFEELHPTNDQIPYVIWMKAVSYSEQFSTIDRDVTSLESAQKELQKLRQRFPQSPYAEKAEDLLREVRTKLAEHDFYVARFYYRDGKFNAALPRYKRILEKFPEAGIADHALYEAGKCHYFLNEDDAARDSFTRLVQAYPESEYRGKAEEFLQDLNDGRYTVVSRYFRAKERVFRWFGYE
ncbi:MAG: outer membrane protein assembly factor BamD [bacterium]